MEQKKSISEDASDAIKLTAKTTGFKTVKVFAPATVANVNCGFDVLGFAMDFPGDFVTIEPGQKKGIHIKKIIGDDGRLPIDPLKNTVTVVMDACLKDFGLKAPNIEVTLEKKMPIGSGLGSSAASSVAGIFALDAYLNLQLSKHTMLKYAMHGEKIACGAAHADNVGPSLFGGLTLIRGYDPIDIINLPTPGNLYATVIHPKIEVNTKDARNVLPKAIPMELAIKQWGNVGGLVAGFTLNDPELIKRSMVDVIVEPARSILIPGFDQVKKAALDSHVLGCGISGSGPSVFAISIGMEIAKNAGDNMKKAFNDKNIESQVYIAPLGQKGVRIIENKE